jgi:hypothetical protein
VQRSGGDVKRGAVEGRGAHSDQRDHLRKKRALRKNGKKKKKLGEKEKKNTSASNHSPSDK